MSRFLAWAKSFFGRAAAVVGAAVVGALIGIGGAALAVPANWQEAIYRALHEAAWTITANDTYMSIAGSDGTTMRAVKTDSSGQIVLSSSSSITIAEADLSVTNQMDISSVTSTAVPSSPLANRTGLLICNAGSSAFTSMGSQLVVCKVGAAATLTNGIPVFPGLCQPFSTTSTVQCLAQTGTTRIAYGEAAP